MVARIRIRGTPGSHRMRGQDLRIEVIDRKGQPFRDGDGDIIRLPVRAAYLECGGRTQPVLANLYCDIAELDVELDGELHQHVVAEED